MNIYEKAKYDTGRWAFHVGRCSVCYWGKVEKCLERMKKLGQSRNNMSGGKSKVWCCKEQYCIGTWNVRFMNQGKLDMVKQEMTRVSIDILWMSELKCMRMYGFNSDDHYVYYCGQESLRRNGVALIVNKRVWNAVLGCSLKNDKMIAVHFQGKPFNITVIQVYTPTSNAEGAEVEWFYKDIQNLLDYRPKKISFSL